jgi:Glucokinase
VLRSRRDLQILVAEIGRTHAHVALFDAAGRRVLRLETFRTGEHDGVAAALARFLDAVPEARIESACIGVGVSVASRVYAHELAEVFELPSVAVVDGLEAHRCRLRDLAQIAAERLTRGTRRYGRGGLRGSSRCQLTPPGALAR